MDLCEFQVSLSTRASSRTGSNATEKQKKKKKKILVSFGSSKGLRDVDTLILRLSVDLTHYFVI